MDRIGGMRQSPFSMGGNASEGFVAIVGAGPWDPTLITLAGVQRLRRADVVVADYLANPNLLMHAPPDAEIIQRTTGPHGMPLRQDALNDLLVERARAGKYVVRLKGGDPCLFGRGAEEAQVLRAAGIDYEFIPGVSSPIAAPEVAGIPVTHRDHTPAVTFVSGYEAYQKAGLHVAWEHLAQSAGTLVLMMSVKNARVNAQRLIEAGRDPTTPAAVVRWGTRGTQAIVEGVLHDIADRMEAAGLRAPSVLVVGDVVRLRNEIGWVQRRPLFGRRIVVTRPRGAQEFLLTRFTELGADAVALPCLELRPPEDPRRFERAVASVASFDGVIVSSRPGATALFDALSAVGLDARALAGRTVVAVGQRTAAACRDRGVLADVVPERPRSEGIRDALADRGELGRRWLHVRARDGRSTLGDAISAAGGHYELAIGYRTELPNVPPAVLASLRSPDEGGEGVDAFCLHSGRSGAHLSTLLEQALGDAPARRLRERTTVFSAGPVTTKALHEQGFQVSKTAQTPDDEAMLSTVLEFYSGTTTTS